MKVTALIPDDIIADVTRFTRGKNTTDSLIKALEEWLYTKRVEELNNELKRNPVEFIEGFSAEQVRKLNNTLT